MSVFEYKKPDTKYPLSRIEVINQEGGGGGGDAPTATDEEINKIINDIWDDDDAPTASNDDVQNIIDGIFNDGGEG